MAPALLMLAVLVFVFSLLLFPGPTQKPATFPNFARLTLAFMPREQPNEYSAGNGVILSPEGLSIAVPRISADQSGEAVSLQLQFLESNPDPVLEADTQLPGHINEYRGQDSRAWRRQVPTFAGLTYKELYPGVDLHYSGTEGQLKGTYTVAPGADPAGIRWRYAGASEVNADAATGDLHILVDGAQMLVEQAPIAWQEIGGERVPVSAAYAVSTDGSTGFSLGTYNPTYPLVIDPTIAYETVYSADFLDVGADIAVNDVGQAWVVAYTLNRQDAAVIKLDTDGTVLFATYLEGSFIDEGHSIEVDAAGNAVITGRTLSSDFPVLNAWQSALNGPADAFVTKLAGSDGSLLFSTYLGGNRAERGYGLALGPTGDIYLTGGTDSTDFPTVNPIQEDLNLTNCFCFDAYVSVLSADGSSLLYSTYYGGGFEDIGYELDVDAAGNIYFAGETESDDFPTANALQPTYGGGEQDGFVVRLSADGSAVDYSTFLGGEELERVRGVEVDPAGYAHIGGTTNSIGFPTTPGAFQPTFAGGINDCGDPPFIPIRNCFDVFASKIAPDGSAFAYSTFLGGGDDEEGNALALAEDGSVYLAGYTYSDDFPGGADLLYISRLDSTGSSLVYTFSPVVNSAAGHGAAVDAAGDVYVTGANNVPADTYVVKLDEDIILPTVTPPATEPPPTATAPPPTATPPPEPEPLLYLPIIRH
jgi:hypothetical protein